MILHISALILRHSPSELQLWLMVNRWSTNSVIVYLATIIAIVLVSLFVLVNFFIFSASDYVC